MKQRQIMAWIAKVLAVVMMINIIGNDFLVAYGAESPTANTETQNKTQDPNPRRGYESNNEKNVNDSIYQYNVTDSKDTNKVQYKLEKRWIPEIAEKKVWVKEKYLNIRTRILDKIQKEEVWIDTTYKEVKKWVPEKVITERKKVEKTYKTVREWVPSTYKTVKEWVPETYKTVIEWVPETYKTVKKWIPSSYKTVKKYIAGKYETIKKWVPSTYKSVKKWVPGKYRTSYKRVNGKYVKVKKYIKGYYTTTKKKVSGHYTTTRKYVAGHYESTREYVPGYYKTERIKEGGYHKNIRVKVAGYYKTTKEKVAGYYKNTRVTVPAHYEDVKRTIPGYYKTVQVVDVEGHTIIKEKIIKGGFKTEQKIIPGYWDIIQKKVAGHFEMVPVKLKYPENNQEDNEISEQEKKAAKQKIYLAKAEYSLGKDVVEEVKKARDTLGDSTYGSTMNITQYYEAHKKEISELTTQTYYMTKMLTQKDMEVIGSSTGKVNYGERVEVISKNSQSAIIRYQVSGGVKHAKVELKYLSRTKPEEKEIPNPIPDDNPKEENPTGEYNDNSFERYYQLYLAQRQLLEMDPSNEQAREKAENYITKMGVDEAIRRIDIDTLVKHLGENKASIKALIANEKNKEGVIEYGTYRGKKLGDLREHELRVQLTSIYILWADAIGEKNRYSNHKEYPQKVKKLEELTQELKEVVQYVNDPNLDKVFKKIQSEEIKNLGTKQLDYLRVYCSIQDKTDLHYDGLAILHGVLDVAGMFGIDVADVLNATIFFIEGKVVEGIFSLIGIFAVLGINVVMKNIYLGKTLDSLVLKKFGGYERILSEIEGTLEKLKPKLDTLFDTLEYELNRKFKKLFGRSQVELVEGALGDLDKIVDISALKSKVDNIFKDVSTKIKKVIGEGTSNLYTGGRTTSQLDDLARDPSHSFKIEPQGIKEREIGLALEESGELGRIVRDTQVDKGAEFIDEVTGIKWDIKSFESYPTGANGVPITNPRKGAFSVDTGMSKINKEIQNGHNVIIDTRNMVQEHVDALKEAIEGAGISDKIIWYR